MPTFRATLCPACRCVRRTRLVGTATINGHLHELVQCPDTACELVWAVRPTTPQLAAA
ncbi:hypothetical protein [Streptomyces mexicanus]|uniref:Uncharacterized protein n=1 Tax=Streptomyces mexicanus TaxID=178566 RepID=A0A7X1I242_9ACTN|nr:hypothetical protein [Streptomyces mexicanus]MBC2867317.1 hypothetical protein [Streptomyces mexicanus]